MEMLEMEQVDVMDHLEDEEEMKDMVEWWWNQSYIDSDIMGWFRERNWRKRWWIWFIPAHLKWTNLIGICWKWRWLNLAIPATFRMGDLNGIHWNRVELGIQHQHQHQFQYQDLLQHQQPLLLQLLQHPLHPDQHRKAHQISLLLLFLGMFYIYKYNVFMYKHCLFVL